MLNIFQELSDICFQHLRRQHDIECHETPHHRLGVRNVCEDDWATLAQDLYC